MRHLFVINPTAGKHTDPIQLTHRIRQIMADRSEPYQIQLTRRPHHAEEMIREAAASSSEPLRVYVFGGDGTLNEAVNGAAGYDHTAITVCPTGSGNDFLKIFGKGQQRFTDLTALVEGEETQFDLIECNGRLAVNLSSVGLDARVGVDMVEFKHLPFVSGSFAYILSLLSNVMKGIHSYYRVEVDGETLDGDYTLMAVCNGRYYGGGFCPVPTAMPDDGQLCFVLVKAVSRLKVAMLVKKYAAGLGDQYPELIRIIRGSEMKIRSKHPVIAQMDGEKLVSDLLSFRMSAKKIRFFYPKGVSWQPETL